MTRLERQIIQTVGIILLITSFVIFVFCWVYRRQARLIVNALQTQRTAEIANDQPPPYPATETPHPDQNRTAYVTTISEDLMSYQQATANDKPPTYESINPLPRYSSQNETV